MKLATLPIKLFNAKGYVVSITEAKLNLESLLERVLQGELIFISKYGKPVAWLQPINPVRRKLRRSSLKD